MLTQKKILDLYEFLVVDLHFYPGPEHHREAAVPDRDPIGEPPGQAVTLLISPFVQTSGRHRTRSDTPWRSTSPLGFYMKNLTD